MITKEQQSLLDREADKFAMNTDNDPQHTYQDLKVSESYLWDKAYEQFTAGAQSILSDPGKWDLVRAGLYEVTFKRRAKLEEENQRLWEALEYLLEGVKGLPPLTAIAGVLIDHCRKAKQALEGVK